MIDARRFIAPGLPLVLLGFTLTGCGTAELTSPDTVQEILFGDDAAHWPHADWTLREAGVRHDTLSLRVQYTGGCALHRFWLLVPGDWVELPTMSIIPAVSIRLDLAHDDHGDACKAALTETLRFDLAPLRAAYRRDRGPGAARVILHVPVRQGATDVAAVEWMIGIVP